MQTTIDLVWQSVSLHPERPALRYLTAERTVGWLSYKQASWASCILWSFQGAKNIQRLVQVILGNGLGGEM